MKEPQIINRRSFVKKTGLLVAGSLLPLDGSAMSLSKKYKYKMGLQLFTIRDAMEKDPVATLKTVASLCYQDLETYGYDVDKGTYYGYKASDFKTILDDLELSASSGHYGFSNYFDKSEDELKRYVDQCIEGAHVLNKSYITWPWLAPEQRSLEKFKQLTGKLNKIGAQVKDAGLGFAYHNHGFEFVDHNGENGYDIILKETDPDLVKLQLDLYWVKHSSKISPEELVAKQPDRFVMWHIKDMDKVTRDYSELGNGSIDYDAILANIDQSGLEFYYLEQGGNFANNSMQSIADSATYFKKHLRKYL